MLDVALGTSIPLSSCTLLRTDLQEAIALPSVPPFARLQFAVQQGNTSMGMAGWMPAASASAPRFTSESPVDAFGSAFGSQRERAWTITAIGTGCFATLAACSRAK